MSKNIEKNIREILNATNFEGEEKKLVLSSNIQNIQIFGNDVIIDLNINNPTLQFKDKVKELYIRTISNNINLELNIEINLNVVELKKEKNIIRGDSIEGIKNIIAVASGKGGVGKSTISANLAVGLANLGYKVGVVDADIYGPSMHIMFDLHGVKPTSIKSNNKIRIKPLENYNVKVLSIASFVESNRAIVWRGPMASKALNQMLWDAEWGDLDYMIVDLPPGTGDIHLSLVQSIPVTGAIIVSTPQDIALADASKGINMFQMENIKVPIIGLVENMSYFVPKELPNNKYFIFGKDGVKNLADKMAITLLEQIPLVQSVREASDAGRPAILQVDTEISNSFISLCENFIKSIKERNINLAQTSKVDITHNKGCSS
ncbi:MAG: Mrp/NBP35 family ATP-binding protein [Bacteroidota bacterium]|nr:Mrp/NBP35 family ATP-binding protein [Bacteroidota bacterium]